MASLFSRPHQILLLVIALWVIALAWFSARRRSVPGAMPLSRLLLAVAGWSLGYLGELTASGLETKLLWTRFTYAAIVIVPVAWLLFCQGYTGRANWLRPRRQAMLVAIPALTVGLVWTNSWHGLFWRDVQVVQEGGLSLLKVTYGPAFWLHASYSYLLVCLGIVLIVQTAATLSGVYRRQTAGLLIACSAPLLANALHISGVHISQLDLSPFAFALSGSAFTWALLRDHLLDIMPVARSAIVQTMRDGVIVLDVQGRVLDMNPAARAMLALDTTRAYGRALADVFPQAARLVMGGPNEESRVELELADRKPPRYLEVHLSPLLSGRHPSARLLVLRDVTRRKRQERALAESEARYRAIVEDQTELICRYLPDGTFTYVNEAGCRYMGLPREELEGHSFIPYIHPDDRHLVEQAIGSLCLEQPTATYEHRAILPNGNIRWLQWTDRAIFDGQGLICDYQSVGRDVTDRKQAEEALLLAHEQLEQRVRQRTAELARANQALEAQIAEREQMAAELRRSEERFRALFTAGSDAIFVHTLNGGALPGCFTEANHVACERLGYSLDELRQHSMLDIDLVDREKELPAILARLQAEGHALFESRHLTKDGREIPVEVSARLFDLDGQQTVISIARDIRARRRLQEQFLRSQKMELLGRLAGGVAHDFNNLLTAISGHAGFAASLLPPGHEAGEEIAEVHKAAERAADLTRQLLTFSRRQVIEPRVVDLNEVVSDLRKMLGRLIGENIELVTELEPSLASVRADPGQIEQVLVNLAVNARDAMPDGGRLTISTGGPAGGGKPHSGAGERAPGGRYVRLSVSDTGVGMSEETKAHLFEPFFTTKEAGKGTGLGLATVYGIVKQHGGDIQVSSETGRGTQMDVYLPCAQGQQSAEPERALPDNTAPGSETLLLVEDDEMVRTVTARMLVGMGYRLLVASDGDEAVRLAEKHRGKIDLVVSDVVMPGVSGEQLASRLSQASPAARILFVSGYTDNNLGAHEVSAPGRGFLEKPFSAANLSRKIRQVLEGPPPGRKAAPSEIVEAAGARSAAATRR